MSDFLFDKKDGNFLLLFTIPFRMQTFFEEHFIASSSWLRINYLLSTSSSIIFIIGCNENYQNDNRYDAIIEKKKNNYILSLLILFAFNWLSFSFALFFCVYTDISSQCSCLHVELRLLDTFFPSDIDDFNVKWTQNLKEEFERERQRNPIQCNAHYGHKLHWSI